MPHLKLDTPTGPIELHYSIATPSTPSSTRIAPHLPCILFLHSGWVGQEIFEMQFQDPRLRMHFNLIAVDLRGYGTTRGQINKQIYTPTDAADDVYRFIIALDLEAVHVFGLAIGGCVALELATAHPDLINSLTLCSPLPGTEPEDIVAGRLEVYDCWVNAFNHDGSCLTVEGDQSFLNDLKLGAQQLSFNNERSSLTDAITEVALRGAIANRAGTPEKLKMSYHASVGMFIHRRPQSLAALSKIRCPIRLIHCEDDIAYPLQDAQDLEAYLRRAGVTDIVLYEVSGPHYGNVINPQAVNPILLDVALSTPKSAYNRSPTEFYSNGRCPLQKMVTPFTNSLASCGYDPHQDDDSDTEDC